MTIDHDAIAAQVRNFLTTGQIFGIREVMSAYLDLYDEVTRLRAERDAGKRTVPAGQTPLDDKLIHRFLDVIREGEAARDAGTASPYHGHSLEHCLHATGWVLRDLRLALDEARARAKKAEAERDALRAALEEIAEGLKGIARDIQIGPDDEGREIYDMVQAMQWDARQALKGQTNE